MLLEPSNMDTLMRQHVVKIGPVSRKLWESQNIGISGYRSEVWKSCNIVVFRDMSPDLWGNGKRNLLFGIVKWQLVIF
jgi:hypothetical protein